LPSTPVSVPASLVFSDVSITTTPSIAAPSGLVIVPLIMLLLCNTGKFDPVFCEITEYEKMNNNVNILKKFRGSIQSVFNINNRGF
jgi:hypothetical protein